MENMKEFKEMKGNEGFIWGKGEWENSRFLRERRVILFIHGKYFNAVQVEYSEHYFSEEIEEDFDVENPIHFFVSPTGDTKPDYKWVGWVID